MTHTTAYGLENFWQQSDIVIKTVAITLLIMSIASWCAILIRSLHVLYWKKLSAQTGAFWQAPTPVEGIKSLDNSKGDNPFYFLAAESQNAVEHHREHKDDLENLLPLTEWLTLSLRHAIDASTEKLQGGMGLLASVGSTSPFIGLFGTVWGIYHALGSISMAGHANISAVAGPVGEALIMTAFGLVVAIPAVLGYNAVNRANKRQINKLNRFAHELHAWYLTGAKPQIRQ